MRIPEMIQGLDAQIGRLTAARTALIEAQNETNNIRGRGRPRKAATIAVHHDTAPVTTARQGRTFTPAQRKAQAARMRKYWAARKRAKK